MKAQKANEHIKNWGEVAKYFPFGPAKPDQYTGKQEFILGS